MEQTPEREQLVEELLHAMQDLAALMHEQGRNAVGTDVGVFLHQSVARHADEGSLRRITTAIRTHIAAGAPVQRPDPAGGRFLADSSPKA
jgi:hypothetical protein